MLAVVLVQLYTFEKKRNSTAQPTGTGTQIYGQGKEPLNVLAPSIAFKFPLESGGTGGLIANPTAYNYAYIQAFGRYYWITGWTNTGPLWYASMSVDPLASHKTDIGSNRCYVYRAADEYDTNIPDTVYPTKSVQTRYNVELPKIFTVDGANYNGDLPDSGYFVCNIVGYGGVTAYAMRETSFKALLQEIYNDRFFDAILTEFGALEYPEAKVAVNPMQYITGVKWLPASVGSLVPWGFHSDANVDHAVQVGPVVVSPSVPGGTFDAYRLLSTNYTTYPITLSGYRHSQHSRGIWTEYAPYTSYELNYPPFGLIQLDPVEIAHYDTLYVRVTFDGKACTIMLDVFVKNAADTYDKARTLYRSTANASVDVPVSGVLTPGYSNTQLSLAAASGIAGIAEGILSGSASGFVGGLTKMYTGIGQAVAGKVPHVSTSGSFGSAAALGGTPSLYITHWELANEDVADKGRPLCQVKTLNTLPGYILADSDNITVECTMAELDEIKAAVSGGFFYE